jgi:hypothetical protein
MVGLSVAVVVFGAAVWPGPVRAAADQIASARSEVDSLHAQVVASAGRIRGLTLAYEEADTEASTIAQQVTADQANLARLRGAAATTVSALRSDAIVSYTGGAANTGGGGGPVSDDPAVRAEYLVVAAGDLSDAVDQYRTEEGRVASAESTLSAELRARQAAELATDRARRDAVAEAAAVQNQLGAIEAELSHLVAAQAAAAARAAAMQGLPVNGGLVSAIRTVVAPGGGAGGVWLQLRECESGNNYRADTGNGFFGAYQFSPQTWANLGYPGRPDLEPPAMQDQAAQKLQSQSGWGQWPACSAALGLH